MMDFHLVWSLAAFGGFSELNRLTYPTNYLSHKTRALFKKGECYGKLPLISRLHLIGLLRPAVTVITLAVIGHWTFSGNVRQLLT